MIHRYKKKDVLRYTLVLSIDTPLWHWGALLHLQRTREASVQIHSNEQFKAVCFKQKNNHDKNTLKLFNKLKKCPEFDFVDYMNVVIVNEWAFIHSAASYRFKLSILVILRYIPYRDPRIEVRIVSWGS